MGQHDAVTIVKQMTYRGQSEEWSNTYMLDGVTPTNEGAWKALADAIIASEKTCYNAGSKVVRAYGYEADNDHAVWSYDYAAATATVPGTAVTNTGFPWAGDQAGWLRMRAGTTSSGKPKYIRKYFHSGGAPNSDPPDAVMPSLRTAYIAHGTKMTDGTLPGQMKWIAPGGTVGTLPAASPYVTTRTLKRRGRRPT